VVVGGQHGNRRFANALRKMRQRGSDCGAGVARGRLKKNVKLDSGMIALLTNETGMALTANNDDARKSCWPVEAAQPVNRLLEKAALSGERKKLLRPVFSRQGPKTRTESAGKYDCHEPAFFLRRSHDFRPGAEMRILAHRPWLPMQARSPDRLRAAFRRFDQIRQSSFLEGDFTHLSLDGRQ
jgi:hypothetical protein